MQRTISYDEGAKGFLILLLIGQFFFTNGIFLFIGALVFAFLFYYLQQPYKPSVFSVIFIYHFIQVAATVWLSNYIDQDINYRSDKTVTAIILSYIGLFCVFVPIIYYQNKIPAISISKLREDADSLSLDRTFRAYVISFFAMNALGALAFLFSGLSQIIFSLIKIKWFFFILFGIQVFLKKKKKKEFYAFAAFEFISGFYSYFSDFKTVMFFMALLFFFFMLKVSLRPLIFALIMGVASFFLGAYFQGIKGEYRQFINKGSNAQVVSVEKDEALNKLLDIAQEQKEGTFSHSVEEFLDRFQYTYHLAKAMEYVPEKLPYQNGSNWGTTLEFALTPRLLNPSKPNYEASVKTSKFTGLHYARARQGVSVSLGYFADSYVDFGYVGMFIPLLLLGFLYGSTYFFFIKHSSDSYIFNFSVVCAMYMEFYAFEMDSTFLVGRLFATLVTFFLLQKFFFPWLIKYLREAPKTKKTK
ncbi:MAG TPA: hypothetical protein VK498_09800 [Ferruginibacter sp.]|nr:hypothetical protein [Ferruginibacter sp.]